jgi:hypothetical protein
MDNCVDIATRCTDCEMDTRSLDHDKLPAGCWKWYIVHDDVSKSAGNQMVANSRLDSGEGVVH